jgi:hypothetical protein
MDPRNVSIAAASTRSRFAFVIGDATTMRGRFVDCMESVAAENPCARVALGAGVAYGVDSEGDVVGDDEGSLAHFGPTMPFDTLGSPVLWRDRHMVVLSSEYGAAYAIAEDGTIVGTVRVARYGRLYSGFVADARDAAPRARPLDAPVTNLGGRHVLAAFGVSDNRRILVLVIRKNDWRGARKLGVLIPIEKRN